MLCCRASLSGMIFSSSVPSILCRSNLLVASDVHSSCKICIVTLIRPAQKRDRYLETCIEARDRVEYERRKKNKERAKVRVARTVLVTSLRVPYLAGASTYQGSILVILIACLQNFEAEFPISGPEFEGDVTKTIFKLMAELDER